MNHKPADPNVLREKTMSQAPDHRTAESDGAYENITATSVSRGQSPAHLAVEQAIRDLKTPPPTRRRVFVTGAPAEVTVTTVLRKFADLRKAVSELALTLRSEGVPPERMLPQIKLTVTDVIASEGWKDRAVEQLVIENVVRWAIDAYYSD